MGKKRAWLLALILCLAVGCAGCGAGTDTTPPSDTDRDTSAYGPEGSPDLSGWWLNEKSFELVLSPDTESEQRPQEIFRTRTGSITVTAEDIPEGAEVLIRNYYNGGTYGGQSKTLTPEDNSITFANLSSSDQHEIGAVLTGSDDPVTLVISEGYNKEE